MLPRYHRTIVEGNTLVSPPGNAASLIWFGGDQGLAPWYRKGVLSLVHNTLVARSDQSQVWKVNAVEMASAGEAVDARNNILAAIPATPGGTRPDFGLLGRDNRATFGRNWVTGGWLLTTTGDYSFTGHAAGIANLFSGSGNDPGFVDLVAGDYRLASGSPCIDAAARLPDSLAAWPVTSQFRDPVGSVARPVNGPAADLGSFEAGVTVVVPPILPPAPEVPPPPVAPFRLRAAVIAATRVRLTWTDRSRDETGFVVERWQAGGTWTRVATTSPNTRTFVDTTVSRGKTYAYRLRAMAGPSDAPRLSAATAVIWIRTPRRGR